MTVARRDIQNITIVVFGDCYGLKCLYAALVQLPETREAERRAGGVVGEGNGSKTRKEYL